MINEEVNARFLKFLKEKNINFSRFGELAGVKQSAISRIKQNKQSPLPYLEVLDKLGLNINWLITGEGEMLSKKVSLVQLDVEDKNDYKLEKICDLDSENKYKLFKDISGYNEDTEQAIARTLRVNPDEDVKEWIDFVNNYEEHLKSKNLRINLYSLVYNKGKDEDIYNKHLKNNILLCVNTNELLEYKSQQYAIRLKDMRIGEIRYLNEPVGKPISKLPSKISMFHYDLNDRLKVENEILNLNEFDLIVGTMNNDIIF